MELRLCLRLYARLPPASPKLLPSPAARGSPPPSDRWALRRGCWSTVPGEEALECGYPRCQSGRHTGCGCDPVKQRSVLSDPPFRRPGKENGGKYAKAISAIAGTADCTTQFKDILSTDGSQISCGGSIENLQIPLKFALPGKERQDSVLNGLQEVDQNSELVCIHDSARPLVCSKDVKKVLEDAAVHGAAVLGVPVKATIKEANIDSFVVKTLDRKALWEMQTPQFMKPNLLRDGFELVKRDGLEVTDDVSIVEYLKHPVYITEGSYTNIKVTTPDDLLLAERLMNEK